MKMSVCLWEEDYGPVWRKFVDHVNFLCQDDPYQFNACATKELAKFEARTNWYNDEDPVHFKSEEHLVHFLLTWS